MSSLPKALLPLALTTACVGSIGDRDPSDGVGGPTTTDDPQAACVAGKVDVGDAPMRRLTRTEYDNTVRDLLGDKTQPATLFDPDEQAMGFDANTVAPVSEGQVDQYLDAAESLATAAVAKSFATWLPCDATQPSCIQGFVETFGKKAFRRPVDAESEQTFVDLFQAARVKWDAKTALGLVVEAMLVSPQFLYHVELGLPPEGDAKVVPLDPYELASRLSYFLWQSMPDDELLEAAEAGDLDTPEGIEAQARRMLADPKAKDGVRSFHEQWLELRNLDDLTKDPDMFPEWDAALAGSMKAETLAFVDDVVRAGDAHVSTLLDASYSFVDADLAALYGVTPPSGTGLSKVELDPGERSGLLTQASFLAARAHATDPSWVYRGKFVREKLLCQMLPPPPPNVDMSKLQDPDRLKNPDCAGCHTQMDPIGYGFDQYDAIGKFSDKAAAGEILDPSGDLDVSGTFQGAVELSHELAGSEDVERCIALTWVRFAARRAETEQDACSIGALEDRFGEGGGDIAELLVDITKADLFRYRRVL